MTNSTTSLADAMRHRANWLRGKDSNCMECGWGDKSSVVAALYEMADVIDSWSGEYLSKEETHEENQRRRWGTTHWTEEPREPMTMEERRAAVRKTSLQP
jgi:hypothetical protein